MLSEKNYSESRGTVLANILNGVLKTIFDTNSDCYKFILDLKWWALNFQFSC